jgi:hypothetical protein
MRKTRRESGKEKIRMMVLEDHGKEKRKRVEKKIFM